MAYALKRLGVKATVALSIGLGAWTSVAAQSLTWLGTLGGNASVGNDVSLNGVVVGNARDQGGTVRAFRWTPQTGMVDVTSSESGSPTAAFAVSANGQVVVGQIGSSDPYHAAFRWTAGGGLETLWPGVAYACSASGDMVAGHRLLYGASYGIFWRLGVGSTPAYNPIHGMSPDGRIFVTNLSGQSKYHIGFPGALPNIPRLPGGTSNFGTDASVDAIVGWSTDGQQRMRAFLFWINSDPPRAIDLGALEGGTSEALAITVDSFVLNPIIIGYSTNRFGERRAVRWRRDASGSFVIQDLNHVFANLLTPGSALIEARGISLDGRYITGQGFNAQTGRFEAFLLDTQGEGGCNPPNPADVNGDGFVDDADLLQVLFNFGWQRCP